MPENNNIFSGRILKAAIGQEETVQNELMALLYLARTDKSCISFDLFRSSFQLNKSKLLDSFFFVKECWVDNNSRDEFDKKNVLFEGEEYNVVRISLSGCPSTNSYERVFTSVLVKAPDKELESFKRELCGRVQGWGNFPGCLCCALYQGKGSEDVFYVEQEWEGSYAVNNARLDLFDIENAEIYIMNMDSAPVPPIATNAVLGDPQLIVGLRALNKDFGELCVNASAVPWGMKLIDQKTKVFIALAIDVVEQITGKPFENHIVMARKQGVTREELEELLLFMSIYAGFNKAGVFYSELERIFGPKEGA